MVVYKLTTTINVPHFGDTSKTNGTDPSYFFINICLFENIFINIDNRIYLGKTIVRILQFIVLVIDHKPIRRLVLTQSIAGR